MKTRILEAIARNRWAITEQAFRGVLAAVDDTLTEDDYHLFHTVSAEEKIALAETFGRRAENTWYTGIRENVGFLMLDGPIIPRATWMSNASGMISLDTATNEFKRLEEDNRIDTIVLLIDSPGGAVTGLSDFATMVKASSKRVETFAWMAASAAYWIGSAADKMTMSETGEVGSIGVVLSTTDYSEWDKKHGIKQIEIVSSQSKLKRVDITTKEGRRVYQEQVDYLADVFINTVAANRGVDYDKVFNEFGQGAMVMAEPAKAVGMVDAVTDVETFVAGLLNSRKTSNFAPVLTGAVQGDTMSENANTPMTADQLIETYPIAVKELQTKAAATERERIKEIEAVADRFSKMGAGARAAVKKAVDDSKFDPSMTRADVLEKALDAAQDAQESAGAAIAQPREDAAAIAAHASKAVATGNGDDDEKTAEDKRANGLAAAMKAQRESE